jgi:hypothetical protein
MTFNDAAFGPDLVALMTGAFDAARAQLLAQQHDLSEASEKLMALGIMLAVQAGERDLQSLTKIAVDATAHDPQTSQG